MAHCWSSGIYFSDCGLRSLGSETPKELVKIHFPVTLPEVQGEALESAFKLASQMTKF